MMKINKDSKEERAANGKNEKKAAITPRTTPIQEHGPECLELGHQVLNKLKDVEDLIEVIARELARQAKARK